MLHDAVIERTGDVRQVNAVEQALVPPLAVDLDGTLVKTDLLLESILALLRAHPSYLFLLFVWIVKGKAWLKKQVASMVSLDIRRLPWSDEFIEYLRDQRAQGRSLVLATASDGQIARQVADYLKLFDSVFASDGAINLSGELKRDRLVLEFGEKGFDYAANDWRDLAVWASARKAVLVHPKRRVRSGAAGVVAIDRVFLDRRTGLTDRFNALRPAHWLKNLLILFPLFAAGRFHETAMLEKALLAFAAFGCCASSGYLFNDLTDLPADRHHPLKRSRPFAAGVVPLSYGFLMMPVLFTAGSALGVLVSPLFLAIVFAYFATSVAYSLYVKRIALLDVLSLAGLYSLRLIAGFTAVAIRPSHWLLAFSMFLFFSLALVKRYAELEVMRCTEGKSARARGYELGDRELIETMGMASGYVAVLLLALYIAGDTAQILYAHRIFLWPLCPLLLYWVSHIWLTVHRGRMRDDPVVFAATDRTSVALLSLMLLAAILAV